MILYGRNPVMEALRGRRARTITEVWATAGAAREPWLEGVPVRRATPEEISGRCGSGAHQGICAEAGGYHYVPAEELLLRRGDARASVLRGDAGASVPREDAGASAGDDKRLIVALDQVQDPQNLGSICRTAECVGASGVVIPERRAAEVTPAVCKAAAGAVEHLRVARVRNLADFLAQAKEAGCWCYGASAPASGSHAGPGAATGGRGRAGATREPIPYDRPDYRGGVVLVLGGEGGGLRPRVAGACDELVALPLAGRIESLGVSAAGAALLYEILQSRRRALDNAP